MLVQRFVFFRPVSALKDTSKNALRFEVKRCEDFIKKKLYKVLLQTHHKKTNSQLLLKYFSKNQISPFCKLDQRFGYDKDVCVFLLKLIVNIDCHFIAQRTYKVSNFNGFFDTQNSKLYVTCSNFTIFIFNVWSNTDKKWNKGCWKKNEYFLQNC